MNNIGGKQKNIMNFCILFYCKYLVHLVKEKEQRKKLGRSQGVIHWEALQFYTLFFRLRRKIYNQKAYLTDKNEEFASFGMSSSWNSCNFVVVFQVFLFFRSHLLGLIFSRVISCLKHQFEGVGVHLIDFLFPKVQGLCL